MSKETFIPTWTKQEVEKLYELVQQKRDWEAIAEILGKSAPACRRKYQRIFHDTDPVDAESPRENHKWSVLELQRLHGLRADVKLSYREIGEKLGRSPVSCERRFQTTKWAEVLAVKTTGAIEDMDAEEIERAKRLEKYVDWVMNLSRGDIDRLRSISRKDFIEKATRAFEASHIDFSPGDIPVSFDELKRLAEGKLEELGLTYPREKSLPKGLYVIIGDSHGKHTKNGMFRLLQTVNRTLKPKKVIHLGHIFDDDGDISYHWTEYDNLIVVGMRGELKDLKAEKHQYDVVRDRIKLGRFVVSNQYDITDYVAKFVGNIKPHIFPYDVLVNCHRHELFSRCTSKGGRLIASPGCLCEKHIVKTIKQMIFKDGTPNVKLTFPFGYKSYNRMEHSYEYWEQGMAVVEVDADGEFDIHMCRIYKTAKSGYATSFFDLVMTEKGVFKPNERIMINGDMHCDNHDPNVLDIQEQFSRVYKPDWLANVGDVLDNRSLNHHEMKKTGGPIMRDLLKEVAHSKYAIVRMRQWAKKAKLIYGNHERFMADFADQFPQFRKLLTLEFLFNPAGLGIDVTPLKHVLNIGPLKLIHGDIKMFGQTVTNKLEKVSATFGENTVMGNIHYPAIRSGCYSIGLSGMMDQGYNETAASQWMHGFAYCNIFEGKPFISLVNISRDYRCCILGRRFEPQNPSNWSLPPFSASIDFSFGHEEKAPQNAK